MKGKVLKGEDLKWEKSNKVYFNDYNNLIAIMKFKRQL